ncbi:MAG: hypothetical protein M1831_000965 [Alyxoria varia]|nr:MAG: hypothetical protein M1831_000965 [Alyxoria varia]
MVYGWNKSSARKGQDDVANDPQSQNDGPKSNQHDEDPAPSGFVSAMRKVYRPLGFHKGYNFPLFIIMAGAMFGFTLARLQYLDVGGIYKEGSLPGEWYWFKGGHFRIGITMHLACVLPAGFLMVWQFIPVIRFKAILFHRINGYIVIILTLLSNASVFIILRRSVHGDLPTQSALGLLAIMTTIGIGMAYYNIKRLQVDQHRAWMLRTFIWIGTIITLRIIMIISALITSMIGSYYHSWTCDEIAFARGSNNLRENYPECLQNGRPEKHVVVHADFNGDNVEEVGAALQISFGMAAWLAFFLHLIGVEIYLRMTPAEGERLRCVSYRKQLEAGFSHPGSAGLTSDRWGDAPKWVPPPDEEKN